MNQSYQFSSPMQWSIYTFPFFFFYIHTVQTKRCKGGGESLEALLTLLKADTATRGTHEVVVLISLLVVRESLPSLLRHEDLLFELSRLLSH